MIKTKKEKPVTLSELSGELSKYAHEVIFPYIDEHCATKSSSDEMLKLGAEILKEIKDLKEEKSLGDVQDSRKQKVLKIHNNALERSKILSEVEVLEINKLQAF